MTEGLADLIQRFSPGARASVAVRHNGTLYFAVTPKSPFDASLSAAEQTAQLFEKADERLAMGGTSKSGLLFVAILLADMADYDAVNRVWDAWIDPKAPPSRACFQARLANPAMKVEMIMISATG